MHRQMVKRQSLEQQHAATDAVLPSSISHVAHQSQRPNAAGVDTFQTSGHATSSTRSGDTDCIIVTSPSVPVHDQTTARMSQSMGDDVCVPPSVDVQTMGLMKRMQWQALQQELKAARQTVADLERMIRTLEQSWLCVACEMTVDSTIAFCLAHVLDEVKLTRSGCRTAVPAIGELSSVGYWNCARAACRAKTAS